MIEKDDRLEQAVLTRLLRLNAKVSGWVTGIVAGLAIFVATNWLIIKGGPVGPDGEPVIGPHLWLLSHYLIGYQVTFLGSLVGFAYGLVLGFRGRIADVNIHDRALSAVEIARSAGSGD